MKKNYIIFGIVIIILTLISSYYFLHKPNKEQEYLTEEFPITFREKQLETINITGYTNESEITEIFKNITQLNITKIRFYLKWADDIKSSSDCFGHTYYGEECFDTFNLTIINPYYINYSNESKYENIVLNITVNNIPNNQTINATSEVHVFDQFKTNIGTGNWNINISCISANGGQMIRDKGNGWTLYIEIYYYDGIILEY